MSGSKSQSHDKISRNEKNENNKYKSGIKVTRIEHQNNNNNNKNRTSNNRHKLQSSSNDDDKNKTKSRSRSADVRSQGRVENSILSRSFGQCKQ